MKRAVLIIVSIFLIAAASGNKPDTTADLVLRHGEIYTMDATQSWAESLAVKNGKVAAVGQDAEIAKWIGSSTRVIELSGKMVMPSFIDSHVHPISAGMEMGQLDFGEMETKDQILNAIQEYVASHPEEKWIRGNTWQLPVFPNANPQKEWLDAIVPDRPALMTSGDGHSIWVNSKALELAGINKNTPDPEGGRIERNQNGEPSGTLRESASDLVYKIAPKPTFEERFKGLQKALGKMNEYGITGFQDASVGPENMAVYMEAEKKGILSARVTTAQYADPEKPIDQINGLIKLRESNQGKRVFPKSVKIFVDGVVEANTAAMLNPYLDTKNPGTLLWEPQKLNPFVRKLDQEGFQVHFHAIGDRAVRAALDAVEQAHIANPRDARAILAHIEIIDPAEFLRFRKVGAIPCFQPLWTFEDNYIRDLTIPKIGPERSRWIYPMRSVLNTGVRMAFGSDWSVSSVNPLDGIEVAVTRRDPDDDSKKGSAFLPEEQIPLAAALSAYTIGSAYANFWEKETGSLENGKSADLIVLSQNLFEIDPAAINQTKVVMTLLEGKVVFESK